ncbi:peptide chain release factor N(5)-glutamine methyltransferase [Anaerofustis sp.]|uniref:peptide chain release factor N(5)-glutamine methyltransferase n=1 Tax=Anaerofustis sp. TaxID=1872517 RepID=UPI0025C23BA0|nr:peptide chain release factor N(5)-glutamine methyltransferase [Anaerofustis sp.]
MLVKEALECARDKLKNNNIKNPLSEAKYIMKYVLNADDTFFILHLNDELCDKDIKLYEDCVTKRCANMPLSYITGEKEFMGLPFYVDKETLIPRPETEIITEYIINNFGNRKLDILEIGVGSGCISLSIAYYLENARIMGVDINKKALVTANKNIRRYGLEDRVRFVFSDLYDNVKDKYDIIISNPPYIKSDVIETLEDDVKNYEPVLALDGGADGLYFYRKIINHADEYLNEEGYIVLEIGYDQAHEVKNLLEKNNFKNINIIKDLAGFDRTITAQK